MFRIIQYCLPILLLANIGHSAIINNLQDNSGGTCPLSDVLEANKQIKYKVYSPIGDATIKQITQAPRLDTLNNKTIALVGGSFMANITHSEIKRLITNEELKQNTKNVLWPQIVEGLTKPITDEN